MHEIDRPAATLSRLTKAARDLGAVLPESVETAFGVSAAVLPAQPGPARQDAARKIAEAAFLPERARDKAVREALDELARAEAANAIRGHVSSHLNDAKTETVHAAGPEVLAAFAVALADDLEVLNSHAASVPLDVARPENLRPDQFEAFYASRHALVRVETARAATAFIAPVPGDPGDLTASQWNRLGILDLAGVAEPGRILLALRDEVPATVGSFRGVPAPWYAAAARAGARFTLADEATREANAAVIARARIAQREAAAAAARGPRPSALIW
jgi:hypothetical protein